MNKRAYIVYMTLMHFFAFIGLTFTGVFFAMQFGLFNVAGSISSRNAFFEDARKQQELKPTQTNNDSNANTGTLSPSGSVATTSSSSCPTTEPCAWNETSQWKTVSAGLGKDAPLIDQAAKEAGVSPRLIAAVAVPEQLRFFTAEREVYKRYFEPLKLLGTLSQFSLGVTGIKPETAKRIEAYAKDPKSPFYPGKAINDKLLSIDAGDDKARLMRLTDEKNHYWQYYYTAAFIKELDAQWRSSGHPLSAQEDSGVFVTLFNIGFDRSKPNENPKLGGASISVGGTPYTYGELGQAFYDSDELSEFKK